jgi:hypothetical protein
MSMKTSFLLVAFRFVVSCVVVTLLFGSAAAQSALSQEDSLFLEFEPVRFGYKSTVPSDSTLEFINGFVMRSPNPSFGGISGVSVDLERKSITMISDRGSWIVASLLLEDDCIQGIGKARIGALRDDRGVKLSRRGAWDTESLAIGAGVSFVGIERANQIYQFKYGADGVPRAGRVFGVPEAVKELPYNKGLEALAIVPKDHPLEGALVAISERSAGIEADSTQGWVVGGPSPGMFHVKRDDGYDVTDAAFLPEGDLLILERKLVLWGGFHARIKRIPVYKQKIGRVWNGDVLWMSTLLSAFDNLEGISVSTTKSGSTYVTLMSDDNFSVFQRTLLLQFKLLR